MTKYRHRVFGDRHLRRMEEIMRAICADCADFAAELVEFTGEASHVHLLVNYPPSRRRTVPSRPLAGLPTRAFTAAVNGGALTRTPVAVPSASGVVPG